MVFIQKTETKTSGADSSLKVKSARIFGFAFFVLQWNKCLSKYILRIC